MKSTFKLTTGGSINIEAIHGAQTVWVEKIFPANTGIEPRSFVIPADLSGVVAQAIELAGQAALKGPCGDRNIAGFNWPELGGTGRPGVAA